MKRWSSLLAFALALVNLRCDDTPPRESGFQHLALGVDAPLEELPPAFTAEETTALRSGFSWSGTSALAETDEDGNPALYYALLLVRERAQLDALSLSGIHFDPYPLFEEEQSTLERTGILAPVGDDRGTFVFALLPGAIFNELRTEALAGNEAFEVVLLRDAPAAVRRADGTLRYDELAHRGFTGGPAWSDELYGPSDPIGGSVDPLTGGEKIRWLRKLARGFRKIGDLIRRGIAAVRVELGRSRTIRLRIRVLERDSDFLNHAPDPANDDDLLIQAWQGSRRGRPVALRGARVTFAANMWMVQRFVDANGFVEAEIPAGKSPRIQLWLQSESGEILTAGGIFDERLNITGDDVSRDAAGINMTVEESGAYVLGQVTDSRNYAREVLGFTPRAARIVLLKKERPSFAPCLSYVRFELMLAAFGAAGLSTVAALAPPVLPVPLNEGIAALGGALPLAVPDWDMLIQGSNSSSRIVPTHEYGHVHWCAQLRDVSHATVVRGLIEGLQGLAEGADADVPERTLTEAWADFLTAQVVGGVNYFELHPSSGERVADDFFCDPVEQARSGIPCLEDNWRGSTVTMMTGHPTGPEADNAIDQNADVSIGTSVTLLADTFDGPTSTMGTGDEWTFGPSGSPPTLSPGHFRFAPDDESVQLDPRAWRDILRVWRSLSRDWTDATVFGAMELVASDRGESDTEICNLRLLHVPIGGVCKSFDSTLPEDDSGITILTARSLFDPTDFSSCDATLEASIFIAADGIDSITTNVTGRTGTGTSHLGGRRDPVVGRRVTLDPPLPIRDESGGPATLQVDAYRGDILVASDSISIQGSPRCYILE